MQAVLCTYFSDMSSRYGTIFLGIVLKDLSSLCDTNITNKAKMKKGKKKQKLHHGRGSFIMAEEENSVSNEEDAFSVLPNELVSLILLQHVPPMWHVLCQFVCHRWHLLLKPVCSRHVVGKLFTNEAVRGGHLKVLEWARSQGCPYNKREICSLAAKGGHLEMLKWARSQGCPWNEETSANAARGGHWEVLKWARNQGCPWDAKTCAYAASEGHLKAKPRLPLECRDKC